MSVEPVSLDVYHSRIPMRSFEHAAARRDVAEAVIVRMRFSDGSEGWGETLPRPYVTGEDIQTVTRDLEEVFWPALAGRKLLDATTSRDEGDKGDGDKVTAHPSSSSLRNVFDVLSILPKRQGNSDTPPATHVLAAACAIDLAMSHLWLDRTPLRPRIESRATGVLGSVDPAVTTGRLTKFRILCLRDFKLKLGLGDDVDRENLRRVHDRLGAGIAAGKFTFRVDINGGWDLASAPDRVAALKEYGVCVVEQPAFCRASELVALARRCELPLMADESLVTMDDAAALLEEPRIWWNIRLSKNGGLACCLRLAEMAAKAGVKCVVGCMVGEGGILSAAQRRLLQLIEPPVFVEGNYGRFLLKGDLTTPSPWFGFGGRMKTLGGPGLGVRVSARKLRKYAVPVKTLRCVQ